MSMHSGSMKKNSRLSLLVLLIIFSFLLGSCSIKKNRKLLSIFFDGVPEPEVIEKISTDNVKANNNKSNLRTPQIVSIHPDYKSRKCATCHKRSATGFLKMDKKKICISCHKEEKFSGKYVHGPVAVKACNTCHLPHRSVYRKLLVEEGRRLCDLCHRMPGAGNVKKCMGDNCLVCHEPHVADNKNFLNQTGLDELQKNRKGNGQ